jgi:site-specific DNA-cytosine methylase
VNIYIDLFAGIGGFALAARWAKLRFDRHYYSEIKKYPVEVYQKRFPGAIPLGDITNIDGKALCKEWRKGEPAQVIMTGGFP